MGEQSAEGVRGNADDLAELEVRFAEFIEALDGAVDLRPADPDVMVAKILPVGGLLEIEAVLADVAETAGFRMEGPAGEGVEGLPATHPGAEIEGFIHIKKPTPRRSARVWVQNKGVNT